MELLSEVVNVVLLVVLPALALYLTRVAMRWVKAREAEILATLTLSQEQFLRSAVELVVKAAEQSGIAGLIKDEAESKKAYALDMLRNILVSRGFTAINLDELSTRIEAAIRDGIQDPYAQVVASSAIGFNGSTGEEDEDDEPVDETIYRIGFSPIKH